MLISLVAISCARSLLVSEAPGRVHLVQGSADDEPEGLHTHVTASAAGVWHPPTAAPTVCCVPW